MVPIEQKDWTEEDRASELGRKSPTRFHEEAQLLSAMPILKKVSEIRGELSCVSSVRKVKSS